MAKHLLSFDLRADFACFKKPDVNEGLIMTFNCLHKPALLGILGAIAGLKGYSKKGEFPEYYKAFKDLPIGIEPLKGFHNKGNFTKTIIKYTNTVGYANADGNLIITEQTLVKPAYRCYVMLDDAVQHQATLYNYLEKGESVYLPYLGKNEFSAWWENNSVIDYEFELVKQINDSYSIASIFQKSHSLRDSQVEEDKNSFNFLDLALKPDLYFYFERLPIYFDEKLIQYQLADFTYSNVSLKSTRVIESLYFLKGKEKYVQLF